MKSRPYHTESVDTDEPGPDDGGRIYEQQCKGGSDDGANGMGLYRMAASP